MTRQDPTHQQRLQAHAAQVIERCSVLGAFSEESNGLTRRFCSRPMHDVHQCMRQWIKEAGLHCRVDAMGNIIGRLAADDPNAKTLMLGSHLDTVPHAGRFDGILGVMIALSVAELVSDAKLPFHLEVVGFSDEEGVRYRSPYLGSRAITGSFDPRWLDRKDDAGVTMAQAMRDFGLDPNQIDTAQYAPDSLLGYVEVHIEQGPVLESLGLPVGVVDAIAGQTRVFCRFVGRAGHAGTVPMSMRQDAAVAAARLVVAADECARRIDDMRITVGHLQLAPNARNVIAEEAQLSLDIRHDVDPVREKATSELLDQAGGIARETCTSFSVEQMESELSARSDFTLRRELDASVAEAGYAVHHMVSGAGHDAVVMAQRYPSAMLFVRSPGGVSHHPDEDVLPDDVRVAVEVMLRFVQRTAQPS